MAVKERAAVQPIGAVTSGARGVPRVVHALGKHIAFNALQRLFGFLVLWDLTGGTKALEARGVSRTSVWKSRTDFAKMMGVQIEDFRLHPEDAALIIKAIKARTGSAENKRVF